MRKADFDKVLVPNFGLSSDSTSRMLLLVDVSAASDMSKWRSSSSKADADIFDGTVDSLLTGMLLTF